MIPRFTLKGIDMKAMLSGGSRMKPLLRGQFDGRSIRVRVNEQSNLAIDEAKFILANVEEDSPYAFHVPLHLLAGEGTALAKALQTFLKKEF